MFRKHVDEVSIKSMASIEYALSYPAGTFLLLPQMNDVLVVSADQKSLELVPRFKDKNRLSSVGERIGRAVVFEDSSDFIFERNGSGRWKRTAKLVYMNGNAILRTPRPDHIGLDLINSLTPEQEMACHDDVMSMKAARRIDPKRGFERIV